VEVGNNLDSGWWRPDALADLPLSDPGLVNLAHSAVASLAQTSSAPSRESRPQSTSSSTQSRVLVTAFFQLR